MWMKKLHSPPAERNKGPIWNVFQEHILPHLESATAITTTTGASSTMLRPLQILEVAGGSGVHTAHFVKELYHRYYDSSEKKQLQQQTFVWQPSDPESSARESQQIYMEEDLTPEMRKCVLDPPLCLTLHENGIQEEDEDADENTQQIPPASSLDLIVNINMIHISPWSATQGLMKMAQEKLRPGGILYLYGPYKVNGTAVASNLKFDMFLKQKDPSFGVRNLEDVVDLAEKQGMEKLNVTPMPAKNLSVILRKQLP